MIIKTNDEKTITLYRKKYDDSIFTYSRLEKEAIEDMNNTYLEIWGANILGCDFAKILEPKVYENFKSDYIDQYVEEDLIPAKISAYELLAEVIKVLSPEEVEKFARSARS
nr:MAG TPA: hypothetical protein [Caudoviricetes sp.]